MPLQVRDGIVANAEREHPGDWGGMADGVEQQVTRRAILEKS